MAKDDHWLPKNWREWLIILVIVAIALWFGAPSLYEIMGD